MFSKGRCAACGKLLERYQPRWARDPDGIFPTPPRGLHVDLGEPPAPAVPTYRTAPKAGGGRALTITRRWFSTNTSWPFPAFALAWNGVLVACTIGILVSEPDLGALKPFVFLFSWGIVPTYYGIAEALNRSVIHIGEGMLTVRHGPLPWRGRDVPTTSLRFACVRRKGVRRTEGGTDILYEVLADTGEAGPPTTLLTGLRAPDQADYIAWAIREHLGLEPIADTVDAQRAAR